ncbi:MAG: molybdopterin molybdotransferase MoeA, partial [Rhodospirillaceae bacterium]|nr:molybdopterin molybdotransferase MoeA [Rhodospirillaceae bacterium]
QRTHPVAPAERVPLAAARGRILAEDVTAPRDVPPHDNSAVDGFAVYFDDLAADRETVLPVVGRAAAGHPLPGPQPRGTAVRIFTGAIMPAGEGGTGPDTVMMQEDCAVNGDAVRIAPGIKRGANRRKRGEDVQAGKIVLRTGRRLKPQDLGLIASLGFTEVPVRARLRVALFSTGDEVRDPGAEAPAGTVYDANRFALRAALEALGCAVTDLGILPDRLEAIRTALAEAAAAHDLILTSGGVSAGEEDHVKAAVEALGALHFWRLAIKPGRPIAFGQVERIPFIGLPGNPVAVMVTFLRVARPLVLHLAGAAPAPPRLYRLRADFEHKKKSGRREWVRARIVGHGVEERLVKFPRQGAGILSSVVESDGLVELGEEVTQLKPGETVDFLPFSEVDA